MKVYFVLIVVLNKKPVKIKEEVKDKKEEKHEEVCPQCGTISDIDSKYCSKCGYDFKTKK